MKYNRSSSIALAALFCVSQMPTEAYALEDNSKNRATAPYVLSDSDMDRVCAGQFDPVTVGIGLGLVAVGIPVALYLASRLQTGIDVPLVVPRSFFPEDIRITNPNPR